MRAGVLSNDQIIAFLNDNFINTWVPNCELGRIHSLQEPITKRREREGKTFDTTHRLAQTIIKGWKTGSKKGSPVDCLVISPTFELMGRQPANELSEDIKYSRLRRAEYYLTFFKAALAGKQPGLGNIVLTAEQTSQSVLDLFRTPTVGYQDYTVVVIDATAFENGGTLIIDIHVGSADTSGSFDLFDGDAELPTEGYPTDALTSMWGIRPNQAGQIKHLFARGKVFKFGATGDWYGEKGRTNAFHAKISVEER